MGYSAIIQCDSVRLNTSNEGKFLEYQRLFHEYGSEIESTAVDLEEIDADMIFVAVHKASQLPEGVLVEDTSLEIEGADIGVNIRWMLENLEMLQGRKAVWTCLLAQRLGDKVFVYSGVVHGSIVIPRGNGGFGFDPYILPDGATLTLAESKPDRFNARALAVKAFMNGNVFVEAEPLYEWRGAWQHK